MANIFHKFVGASELSDELKRVINIYSVIFLASTAFISFSFGYFILFSIIKFGSLKSGLLIGIGLIVSAGLDFITGVISDKIGQKRILLLSYSCYAIVFFSFSIVSNFNILILIMVLYGLAQALQSGALYTWFTNNYQILIADTDPERKIYGYFLVRLRILFWIIGALSVSIAGSIVFYYSQSNLFLVNALLFILLVIYVFIFMKEKYYTNNKEESSKPPNKSFFIYLSQSIKYFFTNKVFLLVVIGYILYLGSIGSIYQNLINIPISYGYSGTLQIVGIVFAFLKINALISDFIVSKVVKKIDSNKLGIIFLLYVLFLLVPLMVLLYYFPIKNSFNIIALVLFLLINFIAEASFGELGPILMQRLLVDLIPIQIRNSLFSLISTINSGFVFIMLIIFGGIIDQYDLIIALFLLVIMGILGSIIIFGSTFSERKKSSTLP